MTSLSDAKATTQASSKDKEIVTSEEPNESKKKELLFLKGQLVSLLFLVIWRLSMSCSMLATYINMSEHALFLVFNLIAL